MTEPERVFRLDAGAERSVAVLRIIAAVVVLAATIWMVILGPSPICWLGIVGSWGIVVGWFFASRASRRRAAAGQSHYLALRPGGLALAEGGPEIFVPWEQVLAVDADEDKLVVKITRTSGPVLALEPRYAGVGLHELRAAIAAAWRKRREPDGDEERG
jgi:hypothetical protein